MHLARHLQTCSIHIHGLLSACAVPGLACNQVDRLTRTDSHVQRFCIIQLTESLVVLGSLLPLPSSLSPSQHQPPPLPPPPCPSTLRDSVLVPPRQESRLARV